MRRRAESVEATRTRILDAVRDLFREHLDPASITIEEAARHAGVSAMTVTRQFGTKAELMAATQERERGRMVEMRRAPAGDVGAAVHALYDHYEEAGDWGLSMQAFEHVRPGMHEMVGRARASHRSWVKETFAPQLARIAGADRDELITALVVACDLLTWKQLRRDLDLPRRKAESIVRRMVSALIRED